MQNRSIELIKKIFCKYSLFCFYSVLSFGQPKSKSAEPVLIPFRSGENWGLATIEKKIVVEPSFLSVRFGSFNLYPVAIRCTSDCQNYPDGMWGFIDNNGMWKVPALYQEVQHFSEGLAAVKKQNRWGYVDEVGREVIGCSFDTVYPFFKTKAIVKSGENWFLIDKEGKRVTSLLYELIKPFSDECAAAKRGGKWGFLDANGLEVIASRFHDVSNFKEGIAVVEYNTRYLLINLIGKTLETDQEFDYVGDFQEGYAVTLKSGHLGFIDQDGNTFIPNIYIKPPNLEAYPSFSSGIAAVPIGGKWGYVDVNGKELGKLFDKARNFHGELAPVKQGLLWGYINRKGRVVIPFQFDDAWEMRNESAIVCKNNLYGLIKPDGSEITPIKYNYIERLIDRPDLFKTIINNKICIVNNKGVEFCD